MLNVLFASDDNYSSFLGVTLYSLLKNNSKDFKEINVYIYDDNISETNKNKLEQISNEFNSNLIFLPMVNIEKILGQKIHSMNKCNNVSLTTYARLFASTLLPDINKILYLDCDAIVTSSFKELWNQDISNYYAAGVIDLLNIEYIKEKINLKKENNYINAGFLLINLKKWREENIESKFISFIKEHKDEFIFHDQGIINGVLKDKILYVSPKYNLLSYFHNVSYDNALKWTGCYDYYSKEEIEYAQENPVFIHFCSITVMDRPWINCKHPFKNLYKSYLLETPFKDIIDVDSKKPGIFFYLYTNKLSTTLLKLVPKSVFKSVTDKRIKNLCESQQIE